MRNERLKRHGKSRDTAGLLRSCFEPLKPNDKFPVERGFHSYVLNVKGKKHMCACYCIPRYDWLLDQLAKLGVDVLPLLPNSTRVTPEQCKAIANGLVKLRKDITDPVLENDIKFWSNCGGAVVNDWGTIYELLPY